MASAEPANHHGPRRIWAGTVRHVVAEQRGKPPGPGDVQVEAVALVLGEHHDLQEAGVGQVGQGEVDQAVVAAEGHSRLGTVQGEGQEALAFTAGQDYREHAGHGLTLAVLRPARDSGGLCGGSAGDSWRALGPGLALAARRAGLASITVLPSPPRSGRCRPRAVQLTVRRSAVARSCSAPRRVVGALVRRAR